MERAEDHVWSNDRAYWRGRGPEWLDVDRLLSMLGPESSAAIRAYRRLPGGPKTAGRGEPAEISASFPRGHTLLD